MEGLEALRRDGLIKVRRDAAAKFPRVKLTAKGEAIARALAGTGSRDAGRCFLERVESVAPKYTHADGWVPEVEFSAPRGSGWGDGNGRELNVTEQLALPAISAGWVEAHSSGYGHACYRVTAAGRRELANPSEAPDVGPLPEFDVDLGKIYERETVEVVASLRTRKPANPSEVGLHALAHSLTAMIA